MVHRLRVPGAVSGFVLALAVLLIGGTFAGAGPLQITATFDSSITTNANAAAIEAAINSAVAYYNSTFTTAFNQGPVNIYFKDMSSGLGSSFDLRYKENYQSFISNLTTASSGNTTDTTALANLPNGANNPVTNSTGINLQSANARALGFSTPTLLDSAGNAGSGGGFIYDGIIGLRTSITDVNGGAYSLFAVTEHEIDEVLGLGSDVGGTGFFADPAVEDLYRYASNGSRNYSSSINTVAFFSLDGTNLGPQYNNGNNGGDWGDWASSATPRVQDAFATPFATPTLANDGGAEIVALDAIGYNLAGGQAAAPEPATLSLLAAGR